MSSTHSPPSPATKSTVIWLDLLPRDLCTRVAICLRSGASAYSPSLLSLAESSSLQRQYVASSLSCHLRGERERSTSLKLAPQNTNLARWVRVFAGNIKQLSCFPLSKPSLHLLREPTLYKAEIFDTYDALHAVAETASIRHLTLIMQPRTESRPQLIHTVLEELNLTTLKLRCLKYDVDNCLFAEHPYWKIALYSNTNLTSLQIQCSCNHPIHPIWDICNSFLAPRSSIEELAIDQAATATLPDSVHHYLQSLRSINVESGNAPVSRLAVISSQIFSLRSNLYFDVSALKQLSLFDHVRDLRIGLAKGAERGLASLTGALPNLVSLHLRSRQGHSVSEDDTGTILDGVKNAPMLRSLHLITICVAKDELEAILRHMGPQLQDFATTIDEKIFTELGKMETLLTAAACHNHSLQQFNLHSTLSFGSVPCHWPSVCRRAPSIRAAYSRLRRWAPEMCSWSLERYLALLEKDVTNSMNGVISSNFPFFRAPQQ